MPVPHARTSYLARDENGVRRRLGVSGEIDGADTDSIGRAEEQTWEYVWRFGEHPEKELPSEEALTALGNAMISSRPDKRPDSEVPAGYTYLGQFIFHDMTWFSDDDAGDPDSRRSPALDLQSVLGPIKANHNSAAFTEHGPLPIGCTRDDRLQLPEDLPRIRFGPFAGCPLIADLRNDDFLPLAQIHLSLLKFYNAIARGFGYTCKGLNADARKLTDRCFIEHFQSVVLHDYLGRIIDEDVHKDVMKNGRRVIYPGIGPRKDPFRLPIEFPAAAARFGHSMIRDKYEKWNARQHTASVGHFMTNSYRNRPKNEIINFNKMKELESGWITNWFRLFDFRGVLSRSGVKRPIMAKRIGPLLAPELGRLGGHIVRDVDCTTPQRSYAQFNLAAATLGRQRSLGLAWAQRVIEAVNPELGDLEIKPISPADLCQDGTAIAKVFDAHPELNARTPLWYYVLREAELEGRGGRLGPLGSRLVMETVHAAVASSRISISGSNWRPSLPSARSARFSMPDLLAFCGDPDPLATVMNTRNRHRVTKSRV